MSVFNSLLERMASGQTKGLYASLRLSGEPEQFLLERTADKRASFRIESDNQVPVCGTLHSLHPAIHITEDSFQGNSQVHYAFSSKKALSVDTESFDGILICYNGGERVISFSFKKVSDHSSVTSAFLFEGQDIRTNPERLASVAEKECLVRITQKYLQFLINSGNDTHEEEERILARETSQILGELIQIRPEVIRFRLYEAICAVKADNLSKAVDLTRQMRNIITTARKKHGTEYCLLKYLEYEICRAQKDLQGAAQNKKLLQEFMPYALSQNPGESDLVCLMGSECLRLHETDPLNMWETLHDLYDAGNNSPYLYYYGLCVFQTPEILGISDICTDSFLLHCLCKGAKNGLLSSESAFRAIHETSVLTAPYLWQLYKNIYESYPDREILSALVKYMIRMDIKSKHAFSYYKKAVQEQLKISRLFDYYVYAMADHYSEPIDREVLLFYAADSYVNPIIYVKLCKNVIDFYQDDREIMDQYGLHMEAFVRTQISHKRLTGDLAYITDNVITPEILDSHLAEGLWPMLSLFWVKAQVPDGYQVIVENGIFRETRTVSFFDSQACIRLPGGLGEIRFTDSWGNALPEFEYQLMPCIQNKELIQTSFEILADCKETGIILHAIWLAKQNMAVDGPLVEYPIQGFPCDISDCLEYLADDSVSPILKRNALAYIQIMVAEDISLLGAGPEVTAALGKYTELLDQELSVNGFSFFMKQGQYQEAVRLWDRIPHRNLEPGMVHTLAEYRMASGKNCEEKSLEMMLLWLLDHNAIDAPMLASLAGAGNYPMEVQIRLLLACRGQGLPHNNLSVQILERQLMMEEKDWSTIQMVYDELVNHDQYQLLSKAAMAVLSYGVIFEELQPEINLPSYVQGEIMYAGSLDGLPDPVKLAFLKEIQKDTHRADSLSGLRRQLCEEMQEKGYLLDFVQREAAKAGLASYPVITVNLSGEGPFHEALEEMVRTHPGLLEVEYKIEGDCQSYRSKMYPVYECLYSAEIVAFAGESVSYRFHFGDSSTGWLSFEGWDYPLRNRKGLSDRYAMLQELSLQHMQGQLQADQLQNYEVTMELIRSFGKYM